MGEQEKLTKFVPDIRDQKSLTPDERKVNEREKDMKGGLQVRNLYFLVAEFNQLPNLWKADLEMEGVQVDQSQIFLPSETANSQA